MRPRGFSRVPSSKEVSYHVDYQRLFLAYGDERTKPTYVLSSKLASSAWKLISYLELLILPRLHITSIQILAFFHFHFSLRD